jgi:hypothetical protein
MNFKDAQLRKCYDDRLVEAGEASGDLRQVHALIATHDLFQMLEGSHSLRVHETIEHLLSAELRPGLRRWYQRSGVETDYAAMEFRERLSRLAGERLEIQQKTPATQPERANIKRSQ